MTKRELKNLDRLPVMIAKTQAVNYISEKLDALYPRWYLLPLDDRKPAPSYKTANGLLVDPVVIADDFKNKNLTDYYKILELIKNYRRIIRQKLPA